MSAATNFDLRRTASAEPPSSRTERRCPSARSRRASKPTRYLLGAVGDRRFDHLTGEKRSEAGLLALRQALGGFANLRPVKAYEAIADCSPLREDVTRGADILIVRELLGGLYFGEPRELEPTTASPVTTPCATTADEVERVAHVAFQEARRRKDSSLRWTRPTCWKHRSSGVAP